MRRKNVIARTCVCGHGKHAHYEAGGCVYCRCQRVFR